MKINKYLTITFLMILAMKSFGQNKENNNINHKAFYDSLKVEYYNIDDATLSVRKVGKGPALVFIHGYMVNGYTWRYLIPNLSKTHTCYIVESAGFGDTKWSKKTDFSFTAHKNRYIQLFKKIKISKYSLIAHDTGGSIARMIAISEKESVENLILFDTEIPNHRPPFLRLFSTLSYFPFANWMFRQSLKSDKMVKSKFMFKEFYYNKEYLDIPENLYLPYLKPLIESKEKMKGAMKYLRGIEWKTIDNFKNTHKEITARTIFLWGKNDSVTFPVDLAEKMVSQFNTKCKFVKIPNSKVMPQEENPKIVLKEIMSFFNN
jgi:pimeloyl-ACP methyl ester carboxylesterase